MTGPVSGGYISVPSSVWPATSTYTIEIVFSPGEPQPVVDTVGTIFCLDSTCGASSPEAVTLSSTGGHGVGLKYIQNTIGAGPEDWIAAGARYDLIYVCSSGAAGVYVNGIPESTGGINCAAGGSGGGIGGPGYNFSGRMADFAVYNTVLTSTQIAAHLVELGY